MALMPLIILKHNDVKAALIPWEGCRQGPKLTPTKCQSENWLWQANKTELLSSWTLTLFRNVIF